MIVSVILFLSSSVSTTTVKIGEMFSIPNRCPAFKNSSHFEVKRLHSHHVLHPKKPVSYRD